MTVIAGATLDGNQKRGGALRPRPQFERLTRSGQKRKPSAAPKRRGSRVKMLVNSPDDWSVT